MSLDFLIYKMGNRKSYLTNLLLESNEPKGRKCFSGLPPAWAAPAPPAVSPDAEAVPPEQ